MDDIEDRIKHVLDRLEDPYLSDDQEQKLQRQLARLQREKQSA